MNLNAQKCQVITFHRSHDFIPFDYVLNGSTLSRAYSIRDLGVTLSSNLCPEAHINSVICKANKTLGLLFRSASSGLSIDAMRLLFTSLVRSVLEYCCVAWCPYQFGHISRLERIQDRFLRVVGIKLGFDYHSVPLGFVRESLQLVPLITRRKLHDIMFLRRVLLGEIDSPELLNQIELRVGGRTRSLHLFNHRAYATNYEQYSTIPRLHRLGNTMSPYHDFFDDSSHHLKRTFLLLYS